jgi:hypothetical protein
MTNQPIQPPDYRAEAYSWITVAIGSLDGEEELYPTPEAKYLDAIAAGILAVANALLAPPEPPRYTVGGSMRVNVPTASSWPGMTVTSTELGRCEHTYDEKLRCVLFATHKGHHRYTEAPEAA